MDQKCLGATALFLAQSFMFKTWDLHQIQRAVAQRRLCPLALPAPTFPGSLAIVPSSSLSVLPAQHSCIPCRRSVWKRCRNFVRDVSADV